MFKVALIALLGAADVEASSVKHTFHHAGKAAKHAFKDAKNWARSGVKSSEDIIPGSQHNAECTTFKNNCHACVANLCKWTGNGVAGTCGTETAHKDGDVDIADWFTEAQQCSDHLHLCHIGGTGFQAFLAGKNDWSSSFTLGSQQDFTLGWSSASKTTKVPQDYFCLFKLTVSHGDDFGMTQNQNSNTTTWAKINHEVTTNGKTADHATFWDQATIDKASVMFNKVPTFAVGPANADIDVFFINHAKSATLGDLNKSSLLSFNYMSNTEFIKLVALGKGGIIAGILMVLCCCCVLGCVLVWKFLGCIKNALCGKSEGDDGYQRHQE